MNVLRWRVALGLIIAGMAGSAFADPPDRLTFIDTPAFSISIDGCTYQPAGQSLPGPLSGTGTYTIKVGGSPSFTGTGFPFDGILADQGGHIQTNQVGYSIKKDIAWQSALGSGADLTIPAPATIIVSTSGITLTGNATVQLPFRSNGGQRVTASLQNFKLTASTSGAVQIDGDIDLTNSPAIKLGGFAVHGGSSLAHLTIANPPNTSSKGHLLLFRVPTAVLDTPIPSLSAGSGGLSTSAPISLNATGVTIDETGTPNADTIGLGQVAPSNALRKFKNASSPPELAGADASPGQEISLLQPLNFGIIVRGVTASLTNGAVKFSSMNFDLELPSQLVSPSNGRAIIPNVTMDSSGGLSFKIGTPITATWDTGDAFGKPTLSITGCSVTPADGLTKVTGSVTFPQSSGSFHGNESDLRFNLQDFSIDCHGISGTVGLESNGVSASAWGLPVRLQQGAITFDQGSVVGADMAATVADGFGLRISASQSGTISLGVLAGEFPLSGGSGIGIHLTGGSGTIDTGGQLATLLLDGEMTIPAAGPVTSDIAVDFSGLGYQSGKVIAKNFQTVKPVNIDTGPVSLSLSQFTYQASPFLITLNGDAKFPDIFGASGNVSFQGLTVDGGGNISVNGLGVDAAIPGLGSMGAVFSTAKKPFNGFQQPMLGAAHVSFAGLGEADMGILLDKSSWLLTGNVDLGPVTFPLPPAPVDPPFFYLQAINGALGYGIGVLPGNNNSTIDPTEQQFANYQAKPGNYFIQLGATIGTADEFLMWGNMTFSGGFPAVQVDLRGDLYLLQGENPPHDPSRKGYLELIYDGSQNSFSAHGDITVQLPAASLPLYQMFGKLDAGFSPQQGYVYAGYPVRENGFGTEFVGLGAKAGLGIDFWPQHGVHFGVLQFADLLGFADMERGLDLDLDLIGDMKSLTIGADAYVQGSVDFGVISAFARAEGTAQLKLPQFSFSPRAHFEATVHSFLGDYTVDTGDIALLGS